MKKSMISLILIFVLIILGFGLYSTILNQTFTGKVVLSGSGTEEDPYQITDCIQLQEMKDDLSADYILGANIDCTGITIGDLGFIPIGYALSQFMGNFDGQGYEINGLFINIGATNHVGLFGYVDSGSEIKNVHLVNVDITGGEYVGGLVGWNRGVIKNSYVNGIVTGSSYVGGLVGQNGGTIENSYASGSVTGVNMKIGGLVGQNDKGTIENSYASGSVTGFQLVGGLAGVNYFFGTIENSYASGDVTGDTAQIGGLVGRSYRGTIKNSHANGSVTGSAIIGGLVGSIADGTIENSYASGDVTGSSTTVGGLVGQNKGTIENSYASGDVTGSGSVGGLVGGNYEGIMNNSYAVGAVTGSSTNVGGLVGYNDDGGLCGQTCFWTEQTSGLTSSACGQGITTIDMTYQSTFAGWDFVNVWGIETQSFPYLIWETAVELVCIDDDVDGYGTVDSTDLSLCTFTEYDCNDSNYLINPGAAEICDDGIDNNCDGVIDELECMGDEIYWANADGKPISYTEIGDTVMMVIKSPVDSDGEGNVTFTIYESDFWTLDETIGEIEVIINEDGDAIGYWTITQADYKDGDNDDDAEFYFEVEGQNPVKSLIVMEGSYDDSHMYLKILEPKTGDHFMMGTSIDITINSSDEDDLITGNITINGVFVGDIKNGILTFSYTLADSGNTQIVVKGENRKGKVRKVITNIMVIDSTKDGTYVASCINKPAHMAALSSGEVWFNASCTRAIQYSASTGDTDDVPEENIMFSWTFSDGYLHTGLGNESDSYAFYRPFSILGDSWADLEVSVV